DRRGDFRRRILGATHLDTHVAVGGAGHGVGHALDAALHHVVVKAATNEALDRVDGVLRVDDSLALRHLAYNSLAVLVNSDDGREDAAALRRGDNGRLTALHHRGDGVRRPEVNANNLCHT